MASESLKGKRVAIYARYSSTLQREASIEDQVRRCRKLVEAEGGRLDEQLVFEDRAVSGTTIHRDGLGDMMRLIETSPRQIDVIVVEDFSRLSRNQGDGAKLLERLRFHGVELYSIADGVHSGDRSSGLLFGIRGLMSDVYVQDLRDKTKRGLDGRALKGFSTGGLPYGYTSKPELGPNGHPLGARIHVDAERAEVVRRIFREYCSGSSARDIARKLTDAAVPPPRAGTRHRKVGWISSTIREMLRNPAYVGSWSYGRKEWRKDPTSGRRRYVKRSDSEVIRSERPDLRIIDTELWQAAVRRFALHRPGSSVPRRTSAYPFSGLLYCATCGDSMVIAGGARRRYRCGNQHKRGLCENRLSIREETVRARLLEALREVLETPEAVEYARVRFVESLRSAMRTQAGDMEETRRRIARNEAKARKLVEVLADGIDSEAIRLTLVDLEAHVHSDREALAASAAATGEPIRLPSPAEIRALVFDLDARVQQDPARARDELARFFKGGRIVLEPRANRTYVARADVLPLVLLLPDELRPEAGRRHTDLVARGGFEPPTFGL